VQDADAVLLAVHWSRIDDVLNLAGDLSGKVVITCSLPMNDDDSELVRSLHIVGRRGTCKKDSKS
jgi:predicted dinucleotide-binding enzyme